MFILNPDLGDKVVSSATDGMLGLREPEDGESEMKNQVKWQAIDGAHYDAGFRLKLVHAKVMPESGLETETANYYLS